MKISIYSILCILAMQVFIIGCKEDDAKLSSTLPAAEDASFTYKPSSDKSNNILTFTSPSSNFVKTWKFDDGKIVTGDNVTHSYPLKGSYDVTLTVYNAGGSVSKTQTIVIEKTDPTLLDIPSYRLLTGGADMPQGKTWVIDSSFTGHFGVGPSTDTTFDYYHAGPNEKAGGGLYNDRYTFKLDAFTYIWDTKGDVYLNGAQASKFSGAAPSPVGDDIAPYIAPSGLTWTIVDDGIAIPTLTISPGTGFIGYYTGVSTYQILRLKPNELFLRYLDSATPDLAWYIRLVPEGYSHTPPPPPPVIEYKIEDMNENFDGTSNISFLSNSNGSIAKYDNPAPVPINTSLKVGKYVKTGGGSGEFANIQISPGYKFDLHQRHVFRLKVFIPGFNDFTTTGGESWQSIQPYKNKFLLNCKMEILGVMLFKLRQR